jgi:Beta-ketoacyl synthase, N-terminal domain
MRLVLSSRHGEYERTVTLLTGLARERSVSPADFSLSVHSALAGLMSIASGSRAGLTAVAAGRDSFGWGVVEAAATSLEHPETPVLLIHFDAPLPADYREVVDQDERPTALALLLRQDESEGIRLTVSASPAHDERPSLSLASDFMRFLAGTEREGAARGGRHLWRWRRVH